MPSLSSMDVIDVWKRPALRADLGGDELNGLPQHPAGRSPFDQDPGASAGGMVPAPIRTIGTLTSVMSCNLSCSETMWDGSCDFFTYGCC
jgi:mersacidin/lichenicidin family type 2 lantibiotic